MHSKTVGINKGVLGDLYRDVLATSLRSGAELIVIYSQEMLDDDTMDFVKRHSMTGVDFQLCSTKLNIPANIEWLERPIL